MNRCSAILEHHRQRESLQRLFELKRLPSTIMLAGPSGIGKRLVAKELAQSLFCEQSKYSGCQSCKACQVFEHNNSPDFYQIDFGSREQSSVEAARQLLNRLNLKAFSSGARVVIFDNTEQISIQVANGLLKLLEEPLAQTFFILICSNPAKLPQTLVSRCQIWHFDNLSNSSVIQILKTKIHDQSIMTIEEFALLADGSLADLESLIEHAELWRNIKFNLEGIHQGNLKQAFEFSNEFAKSEHLNLVLHLIRIYARSRLSDPEYHADWARFLQEVLLAENLINERNLHSGLVLNNLFLNLARGSKHSTEIDKIVV